MAMLGLRCSIIIGLVLYFGGTLGIHVLCIKIIHGKAEQSDSTVRLSDLGLLRCLENS
jgi:hypothetical protein